MDEFDIETQFDTQVIQESFNIGKISERDKFIAGKQILFGLAVLYVITIFAYMVNPRQCEKLIDICMTTFPPLATIILLSYFKEKNH